MNEVDKLFSLTADAFEANLLPPVTAQLGLLVSNDQKPSMFRLLKEYNDEVALYIQVCKVSDLT